MTTPDAVGETGERKASAAQPAGSAAPDSLAGDSADALMDAFLRGLLELATPPSAPLPT